MQFILEGEEFSFSDLCGKVVLVDFWVSWCGFCCWENFNVKWVYEIYKDQGFEIFGVSFDCMKDCWLKVIVDDELFWLYVSDFQGWKNEVVVMYSVSFILYIILFDVEGKIIVCGFCGQQLEMKLVEIFGVD